MNGTSLRALLRWIHFVSAGFVGTFIYAPWRDIAAYQDFVMFVAAPLLILSGLGLWKQGHLMKWLRSKPGLKAERHPG